MKDVYFSYLGKYPALRGIDMDIRQGEKITVLGANGSGKSTLLHLLDGLIFPQQGAIRAFGVALQEGVFNDADFSRDFRKKVGLVFQNPDIQLFCPTVEEDICFGPLQLGVGEKETACRLEKIADDLGIDDLLQRSPHQLSVGEKRKVAIASTLIIEPQVLVLDEPTAGLDPKTSCAIVEIILRANSAGRTIITATHDLHIVEEISDRVYVLSREKKIARVEEPERLLADSRFLEEHNLIHTHAHCHQRQAHTHPHQHPGPDHHH